MTKLKSQVCFLTPNALFPDKPLFIFLPGMDGTGQLLRTQTVGLETGFDVRCLAIPPDDLTSWDELSKQVVALVEAELARRPVGQPVYLCGESFGGCLALKVALQAPHLFTRIVLVNAASSFHRRPWMLWGGEVIRWFPDFLFEFSAVGLLPYLAALERITPEDRRTFLNTIKKIPKATSAWRLSLLKSFEVDDLPLYRLTQPVLTIASGSDRLLPSIADARHLVSLLPNAKLFILPNSGHACLLEKDVNLYRILQEQDFLPQVNVDSLTSVK
ncbi:alpha/beta fold hydrolase [Altericista sp. CCNU0014]|uniref:alpha/beta fold hydrolase n=1 Tax=Altericista sp. CCNU0014 TaxID=3082949 RepID=UPI00384AB5F0